MQNKIKYDWAFKALNLSDFELTLDFKLDGKLAKYARVGMLKAIKQKTGKNIGKVDVWEDIPPTMYNFVNFQCKSFINHINKAELNPDGINIIHNKVYGGEFKDNTKEIFLRVKITGQYVRDRG